MAEEVNYTAFINLVTRISEESKKKVVDEAKRVGQDINKAAQEGQRVTPQSKPVEQSADAYSKLTQSISAHNRVIGELQKLQGGDQLAQKERLSIIREITQARAKGVIQESAFSNELKKTSTAYNQVNAASKKTLLSIAQWALGWTTVYAGIRAGINLIRTSINDMLKLEEQIARAVSASRAERGVIMTPQQAKDIRDIYTRRTIDLLKETSASYQDAGTALYQLASAGLTANEAISALEPVLDLSIATFGDLEQATRLVASVYRVFESQFSGFANKREAFTHISDVITTAYNQEQIELSELTAAMEYIANTATKVDISFEELVATIGFLGTGLLRGSRAGTDLLNFFSDVIKKADLIKEKLDITIDPKKPFSPVKFLEDLHKKAEENKVTLAVLFDIFGQRGRKSVMEILNRWEEWQRVIKQTNEEMAGTTKRTKDLVSESTIKQTIELKNAWLGFLEALKNTASVFGVLNFLQNYFNNLSRGITVLYEAKRAQKEFRQDLTGFDALFPNRAQIKSYSKALANLKVLIRDMKLEPAVEKKAEVRAELLLKQKWSKESILDKEDVLNILDETLQAVDFWSKQKPKQAVSLPVKFVAGETGDAGAEKEKEQTRQWRIALAELRDKMSEVNSEIEIRNMLLRAYGADETVMIKNNIAGLELEIELLEQQRKKAATPEQREDIESDIFQKRLEIKKEEASLAVSAIQKQKEAYADLFDYTTSRIDEQYELKKLGYELDGRSEKDIFNLQIEAINAKRTEIAGQFALNALLTSMLPLYMGLTEEKKKQLIKDYEDLGFNIQKLKLTGEILDRDTAIKGIQDEINNKERIWNAMGYTGVQIADMTLSFLKSQNVIRGELLDKLIKEVEESRNLASIEAGIAERKLRAEQELSVKEATVSGFGDISALIGILKREEMLRKELELARQLGEIEKENVIIEELRTVEYDKQKALISDMRDIFSGITDSVYGLIMGTEDLSELWTKFNQIVLKKCLETLVEMLFTTQFFQSILGGLGGLFGFEEGGVVGGYAQGGIVSAAGGTVLPSGTSAIPAILHPKEMVLPSDISDFIIRSAKSSTGQEQKKEPINVVNMIYDDGIAASVARRKDVVLNIIGNDLGRNGVTRRSIYRSL